MDGKVMQFIHFSVKEFLCLATSFRVVSKCQSDSISLNAVKVVLELIASWPASSAVESPND
jgi:hypothetical protein